MDHDMAASNRWVGEAKAPCPSCVAYAVAVMFLIRVLSHSTCSWKGKEML